MPPQALDPGSLWSILSDGGLLALSFLVIWGFLTKRIVPGWAYEELKVQHDRALQIALQQTQTTERATKALDNKIQS